MSMELVYPIYVDVEMMTAFLASLEGGLVENLSIEESERNSKEGNKSATAEAKLSQALSVFFNAGGKTEVDKKYTEGLESTRKGNIRFPEASLFIRLRNLLIKQDLVKALDDNFDYSQVNIGDLVEFVVRFESNPVNKLKKIAETLPNYASIESKKKLVELDTNIAILDKMKPNEAFKSKDGDVKMDAMMIAGTKAGLASQKELLMGGFDESIALMTLVIKSIEAGAAETLIGRTSNITFICKAYRKYVREEDFNDVINASWRVIGKVIGIIHGADSFNMLSGSMMDLMPQANQEEIFGSMNTSQIELNFLDAKVSGPALIVATLGIFS